MTTSLRSYFKKGRSLAGDIGWGGYLTLFNHAGALLALRLLWNHHACLRLCVEAILIYRNAGLGVTLGVHRYWSHRSFKATMPLQIFLMLCFTMCFQGDIYWWARDHRSHHKHVNSDADPYNAKRGMFFAHMGWMFTRKSKEISKHPVGVSDLENDPVVQFQRRYYLLLAPVLCYGLPTLYGHYVHADALAGFLVLGCLRWTISSHVTWLVNSLAHSGHEGDGTLDTLIVAFFTGGEGYHNWHHVYPYDAFGSPRTAEAWILNVTGSSLVFFSYFGLAYDMKKAPQLEETKRLLARALPCVDQSKGQYSMKMAKSSPLGALRRMLWESSDPIEGFHREHKNGIITVDGDISALMCDIEASQHYMYKLSRWTRFKLALDLWLLPKEEII